MKRRSHPVRLAVLLLVGAALGWELGGMIIFRSVYGYDHGQGEGVWCRPAGLAIGLIFAAATEILARVLKIGA
ncbi:MAG: hypothetical protein QM775_07305 [Pirellulales bacterium]